MTHTTPQSPVAGTAAISQAPASSGGRHWALIPCAGSGQRAGAGGPKQYQVVAGRPLVAHTLAAFEATQGLAGVLVVVAPEDQTLEKAGLADGCHVADCGGSTRAESVANGLAVLRSLGAVDDDWVLVHDAARCLVTPAQISALMAACVGDPVGGLLAQPLADTLKQSRQGRVAATLERSDKWQAQTPQMFRLGLLQNALKQAGSAVTDEAAALEALGLAPLLVPARGANLKVTYPEDFELAHAVLTARAQASKGAA